MNTNRRSLLLLAFALSAFALPLAAQVNDTYVVPVVANVSGGFGTRWMSQVSVFNPQLHTTLRVSVTFVPTGGGHPTEALFDIPPNQSLFADNALHELYGFDTASGSLIIATFPEDNPTVPDNVADRAVLVTTNTYNNASSGTYGQTVPGTWTGLQDYQFDGISAISHGIRHIAKYGWRTNFGAVNLGSTSVRLLVSVYNSSGQTIANKVAYTLPAQGHGQWTLPVEVDRGSVEFFVDDPTQKAVVFPYTSQIDQYSGDPTYQSPTLLATTKVLYPKSAAAAAAFLGRKLTIDDARSIRAAATSLGLRTLPAGRTE